MWSNHYRQGTPSPSPLDLSGSKPQFIAWKCSKIYRKCRIIFLSNLNLRINDFEILSKNVFIIFFNQLLSRQFQTIIGVFGLWGASGRRFSPASSFHHGGLSTPGSGSLCCRIPKFSCLRLCSPHVLFLWGMMLTSLPCPRSTGAPTALCPIPPSSSGWCWETRRILCQWIVWNQFFLQRTSRLCSLRAVAGLRCVVNVLLRLLFQFPFLPRPCGGGQARNGRGL